MAKRSLRYGLAAAVLVAAWAISQLSIASARANRWNRDWDEDEAYHEEFHHTYPLGAKGELSLENVNGGVHISTWDREEVQVDAVKYARTEDRLANIVIDVDSQPDRLYIKTRFHHNFNNDPGGVRYTLTVPRAARIDKISLVNGGLEIEGSHGDVRADLVNGNLKAHGLAGEVEVSSVNGRQDVEFDAASLSKPIHLNSVNGRIVLTLPSDVNAQIEASTVSGEIDSDFGIRANRVSMVGHQLEGTLGSGGPTIHLSSVNGSIAIRRAGETAN
jgi:hypothetical protein